MKKILIFILLLWWVSAAQSQGTPPGYTNINQRYDWLAGLFKALGIPAGGNAAFNPGQAQRAGALYYDSTGADSGLYVYSGLAWSKLSSGGFFSPDQTAASATLHNAGGNNFTLTNVGVLELNANGNLRLFGDQGRIQMADALELTANGKLNITSVDSLSFILSNGKINIDTLTQDTDTTAGKPTFWNATTGRFGVLDRWPGSGGSGDPNLVFDSLGAAGISPITTWNNTLYGRRISVTGGSVDTSASGGIILNTPGNVYTFSTGLTNASGTITNNLSTGISGGQTLIGGTASGNALTYSSTSHATKGAHIFGTTAKMWFDEAGNKLYVGQATDLGTFGIQSGVAIAVGRGQATNLSKFTFSNNTTGSGGLGIYTSTDNLLSLLRSSGPSIGTTLMGVTKNSATELGAFNGPLFLYGSNQPVHISGNTTAPTISVIAAGRVGLNAITAPTAWLHLPVGTTAASTAPLKFTTASAALQTAAEAGTVEVLVDSIYYTGSGAVRKRLAYADEITGGGSGVTSVATNNGSGITGGTITSTGTLAIDTLTISTRAWRDKLADSLGALISGGMTNPMTTSQDIIVGGASGTPGRLGIGSNGTVLGVVSGLLTYINGTSWSGVYGGVVVGTGTPVTLSTSAMNIYTGSSPGTYNLPDRATTLSRTYIIKNGGTSTLTINRAGSDEIWTSSAVTSVVLQAGESVAIVASSGYWFAYFDGSGGGGSGDMILASVQTVTGAKTFNSGKLITAGSTSGTTTVNSPAVAGTTTVTLPPVTSDIVSYKSGSTTSSSTITSSGDAWINTYKVTALAANPTFAAPSGTYIDGCTVMYSVKDDGTPRTFTWDSIFRGGATISLPSGTTTSKWIKIQFMYNSTDNKFDLTGIVDGI